MNVYKVLKVFWYAEEGQLKVTNKYVPRAMKL